MTDATTNKIKKPAIRYWDDVQVGDEIDGFELHLGWTEMVLQVEGSQDWYPVHHNPDFAKSGGHSDVFFNTGWTAGMLGRVLSDWAGLHGWVKKLSFQMRNMNMLGDDVCAKAKVIDKTEANGEAIVVVDVWLENTRVGKTTPATAEIRLPKK